MQLSLCAYAGRSKWIALSIMCFMPPKMQLTKKFVSNIFNIFKSRVVIQSFRKKDIKRLENGTF